MPTPVRRPTSQFYWIRKKVPERLRQIVGRSEVWRSLETADKRVAVAKCAAASAALEAGWDRLAAALGNGSNDTSAIEPLPLTHQDLHALRGVVHGRIRDAHVANPPTGFAAARLIALDDEGIADESRRILETEGASFTEEDVARFGPLLLRARQDAAADVRRAVAGDYSANPVLAQLPQRTTPKLDLIVAFEEYAAKGALKGGKFGPSAKRWRPKVRAFVAWLGHRDLTKMTPHDAYRWADHLKDQGFAIKSIKDVWLAALSATAGFMVERQKLKTLNPFYGIRVREELPVEGLEPEPPRQKGFTGPEAKAILTATFRASSPLTSVEMKAARRWLPWLCAYSGARVNELTSLYPSDITQDPVSGKWCMVIKPSLEKTAQWRTVPIHSHIIEQKFLKYVDSRRSRNMPLFYDPSRSRGGKPGNPQFKKVGERIGEWLHGLHLIPHGVQPSHGWHHLFKSTSRDVGMHAEIEGFITGHRPVGKNASTGYGDRWIATMSREIEKYPRFEVDETLGAPAPRMRRSPDQIAADFAAKEARKAGRAKRAA